MMEQLSMRATDEAFARGRLCFAGQDPLLHVPLTTYPHHYSEMSASHFSGSREVLKLAC